jgi:hypothetical protein
LDYGDRIGFVVMASAWCLLCSALVGAWQEECQHNRCATKGNGASSGYGFFFGSTSGP